MSNNAKKHSASGTPSFLERFKKSWLGQVLAVALPVATITAGIVIWFYEQRLENRNLKIADLNEKIEQIEQQLRQRDSLIENFTKETKKLQNQLQQRDSTIKIISEELADIKRHQPKVKSVPDSKTSQGLNYENPKIFKVFVGVNLDRKGSKIYINNKLVGIAPDSINMVSGVHQLKLVYKDINYGYQWVYIDTVNFQGKGVFRIHSDAFRRMKIGE